MKRLNYYFNKYDTDAQFAITLEEWLSKIQYSEEFSKRIELARNDGTGPDGTIMQLKDKLPCVTINFLFEETKKNINISGATGYLYIDVDIPGFNISTLDTNKIHAYYRSVRLQGYGIIVRVDGLTFDNFQATYRYICNDLGLELKYDTCAKKATQFNVLSFDPDMFFNPDSFVYKALDIPPLVVNTESSKKVRTTYIITEDRPHWGIRFDNTNDIPIPEGNEYVTNWDEGFQIVKCWLPNKPLKDGRKRFMLSFASNLIWLNPQIPFEVALNVLRGVNDIRCAEPLPIERLRGTLSSIFKQKEQGTLEPIFFEKKRRIVFKPYSKLTKEEKMEIVYRELSKYYAGKSMSKLESIINNWDFKVHGKITNRKICRVGKMSNTTLNKYIKLYKSNIEILNNKNVYTPKIIENRRKHIAKGCIQNNKASNIKEQMENRPVTPPAESGITITNTGIKIKELKRDIMQVIDEFIGAGDFSYDAEIKLLLRMKDTANEVHALDSSIDASKQFSLLFSYYNDSKLKVAS